jgi:hypothetical protein
MSLNSEGAYEIAERMFCLWNDKTVEHAVNQMDRCACKLIGRRIGRAFHLWELVVHGQKDETLI